MKSKKIIAMIVAFAAFMAVATSGFAAVTTTTTYNEIADKVVVDVDVTEATPDSEVTYLVKSNGDIVYIDQKTADASGNVGFDYKIAKTKIAGLATDVKFGTNGSAAITDTTALPFTNVAVTKDAGVEKIEFYTDAACEAKFIGEAAIVGNKDKIYAKITVADGFEIDTVTGLEGEGFVYEVKANEIAVATKATVVTPEIQVPELEGTTDFITEDTEVDNAQGEKVSAKAYTKVVKVVGQPKEVGVEYNGYRFPALTNGGAYESGKLYAVKIIVDGEVVLDTLNTYMIAE
jgi:hypothetical protein